VNVLNRPPEVAGSDRSVRRALADALPEPFVRWISPPLLSHPDLRRRARALWIVSWPLFAVVAVILGIAVIVEPDTLARRAVTVGAVGVLVLFLHFVSRSGRPVLASWMLVIGLTAIVTQRAWITGGIHAPVAVFYVLFIVMASVLIGARGGVVTAAACIVGAIVLTVGTYFEWLTPRPGAGSTIGGFVFVLLAIGLALVIQMLVTLRGGRDGLGVDAVRLLVHDMRTPMQVVTGHLQLLRYGAGGESAKLVDAALDGASTLNRMTNSLLDLSRLEAGQMPVQRTVIDLSVLAQSVIASLRVLQPTRDISVESHGDPCCCCDRELTRRVLENLVSNAMKHTPVEGRVRVSISGSRTRVCITVSDEGPGVPREKSEQIFDPFSARGLRSTAGYESSGLGLAFCRLAVEAQSGRISVEEGAKGGSVFVVDLPR
jgi:signal transduction histidine kinase